MTLPNERYRAVEAAREFLRSLLDPKKTPRISKELRRKAYYVLKHFPANYEMDSVADQMPEIFKKEK